MCKTPLLNSFNFFSGLLSSTHMLTSYSVLQPSWRPGLTGDTTTVIFFYTAVFSYTVVYYSILLLLLLLLYFQY